MNYIIQLKDKSYLEFELAAKNSYLSTRDKKLAARYSKRIKACEVAQRLELEDYILKKA